MPCPWSQGDELDGDADLGAGEPLAAAGGLSAAFAALEVVLDLPDRERAQPGAILAVRESGDLGADEGVELGGLLVADRQHAGADQRGAQVGCSARAGRCPGPRGRARARPA